jgi:hypothetical protein
MVKHTMADDTVGTCTWADLRYIHRKVKGLLVLLSHRHPASGLDRLGQKLLLVAELMIRLFPETLTLQRRR